MNRARLQDNFCSYTYGFFCERNSEVSNPPSTPASAQCPDSSWLVRGSKCYKVFNAAATAVQAQSNCAGFGGQLLQIRNFEESLYLDSLGGSVETQYVYVCISG